MGVDMEEQQLVRYMQWRAMQCYRIARKQMAMRKTAATAHRRAFHLVMALEYQHAGRIISKEARLLAGLYE